MTELKVDISKYESSFSLSNKIGRLTWNFCYWIFFRAFGLPVFNGWRIILLKTFGSKIGKGSIIYSSVKIWAPWNLEVGAYSCLGPNVDCYNQGKISIGANTTISQKTTLCASGHDINDPKNSLVTRPIKIEDQVWVAAEAFIGPGVHVGQGAVVGARSAVFANVAEWTVVGGNPAKFIKERILYAKD